MKTICLIGSVLLIIAFSSCEAGYVAARPADVQYVRPAAPGPDYVWIGGDWVWSGGNYRWREGRWDRRRGNRQWHEGGWENHRNGYRWRKGHW